MNRTYPSFETLLEQRARLTAERDRSEFRSTVYAVLGAGLLVGAVLVTLGEVVARIIAGGYR